MERVYFRGTNAPGAIKVWSSPALKALITILNTVDTRTARDMAKYAREMTTPEWQAAVQDASRTALERKVLADTAAVRVSAAKITLEAGNTRATLRTGYPVADIVKPVEFGADQRTIREYRRRNRSGTSSLVRRHTTHQLPAPRKMGPTYYAASKFIPRALALLSQTVVRSFHEMLEEANTNG